MNLEQDIETVLRTLQDTGSFLQWIRCQGEDPATYVMNECRPPVKISLGTPSSIIRFGEPTVILSNTAEVKNIIQRPTLYDTVHMNMQEFAGILGKHYYVDPRQHVTTTSSNTALSKERYVQPWIQALSKK